MGAGNPAAGCDEHDGLRIEKDADGNPTRWLQTSRDYNYEAKDRSGSLEMFESPDLSAIAAKVISTTAK